MEVIGLVAGDDDWQAEIVKDKRRRNDKYLIVLNLIMGLSYIRLVNQPPIYGEVGGEGGVDTDSERGNGATNIFAFEIDNLIIGGAGRGEINHRIRANFIIVDNNFCFTGGESGGTGGGIGGKLGRGSRNGAEGTAVGNNGGRGGGDVDFIGQETTVDVKGKIGRRSG